MLDYWAHYLTGPSAPLARVNPPTPKLAARATRGLSFWGGGGDMRAADRGQWQPENRYVRLGVRCARDARPN